MDAKLIQVTRKNYRKANKEIVDHMIDLLGIPVTPEAKAKGLDSEQPCRLEKVPKDNLAHLHDEDEGPVVYLDVCHNP